MKLSVSILNAKDKEKTIKELNKTDISYLHIDVMDSIFVSQYSFSYQEVIELSSLSEKKLDVHLMHNNPLSYIEKIKDLKNIEYITIHLEIDKDIKYILNKIKDYGYKRGLSIKPNTNIDKIRPYLDDIDLILVMTVEPGYGGQPFLEDSPNRIKEIKRLIQDKDILLEVDGGINNETLSLVKEADIAVVGSYITTSDDPISRINNLLV
ncbi:MAG: ribulose-phosphate 3-epimerase [Bacilli bacterium]